MMSVSALTGSIAATALITAQLVNRQFGSMWTNRLRSFRLDVSVAAYVNINAQQLQSLLLFNSFKNIRERKGVRDECGIFCHTTETEFLSKTRFLFMLCTFFLREQISKLKMYLRCFTLSLHSNLPIFQPLSVCPFCLIIASILLFMFPQRVSAQDAIHILSHQFDPDTTTIGDPVQLRLWIEADADLHIYLDPIEPSEQEHIEVSKPQVKEIKSENAPRGKIHYEVTYPLRCFAIGTQNLPPITIKYTDEAGNNGSIQTPAYRFEVQSVKPPDATEMKEIKGPWSVPPNWFLYILVVLLVIVIVGALVFLYLRKRAKPIDLQSEVVSQRQPHEIAYEQLNRIEGMNWIAQGEMKVYHTEISHIIRQYIAARYHIPALELTTQELLDRLQTENIPKDLVQQFFTNCDLVKFARYSPTKPEAHERMEEAHQIVDETKQFWIEQGGEQEGEIDENL